MKTIQPSLKTHQIWIKHHDTYRKYNFTVHVKRDSRFSFLLQVEWPAGGRSFLLPSSAGGGRCCLRLHERWRLVWFSAQRGAERTSWISVWYVRYCCRRPQSRRLPGWGHHNNLILMFEETVMKNLTCFCLPDFAVGAPFHETGSVMIWTGSSEGVSTEPSQVAQEKLLCVITVSV